MTGITVIYDPITKTVLFQLNTEGYKLKMPRDHAIRIHDLLHAQLQLCKLSNSVSHTTVFRSRGRIITFEMSRTNGLNISVRELGGRVTFKDTISWSYAEDWVANFAFEMRY